MNALDALKRLERIKAFVPTDLDGDIFSIEDYLYMHAEVEERMQGFEQGFAYKPNTIILEKIAAFKSKRALEYIESDDLFF